MAGSVAPYTALITSEHSDKSKFVATVAASVQPFADLAAQIALIPSLFDVDNSIGKQLDVVGQWVGVSRNVATPLTGVYFSLDTAGLGLDQGILYVTGQPTTGLIALPDDIFRLLIRARIIANHWAGSIPGAYAVWAALLVPYGFNLLIQDNGDMTMTLAMASSNINPTFFGLFVGGYLDLRPAGVQIVGHLTPSVPGAPFFGLNVQNPTISGLDVGAIAQFN